MPWQFLDAELTSAQLERLDREVLLMREGMVLAGGAEALGRYVGSSPSAGWRVVGAVVRLPGVRGCARVVYGWVARNRRRLPGGTGACAVRGGGGTS
ncbi:DCC1-like thiol-disulfide oxidoreductase family protein [Streptomyces acidiscabies]|uniref:DCC1-like thiol-disulfide oxidoreductase family protein n=1 Tax=Streptomyces acidiscabies TaxID=42234 RepID=UPI0038F68007